MKPNYLLGFILTIIFFTCVLSCQKDKDDISAGEITAELINNSGCKKNKSASVVADHKSDTSCVSYSYDAESKTLTLKHINAGFNCCPEILYCNSSTVGDTIIISESEKSALCHCNCLFDLDIKLTSVEATNYVIKLDEQYCGDQMELVFEVDLKTTPTGEYCVDRDIYPWGI